MIRTKGKTVEYMSVNENVSGYLAVPEGPGPFPALILIHEWWGLNSWIKNNANDFADRGYVALAIDLYRGKLTSSPDEARKLSASVPPDRAAGDLASAFNYLKRMKETDPNRIGTIGWCMGGGYSLRTAIDKTGLAVCVVLYGRLIKDTESLKKITCPLLGIFGEDDRNITPADVNEFSDSLNMTDVNHKIIIYPEAGHAFMNPGNANLYNKEAASKAWEEIYTFLIKNLKNKS